MSDWLQALKRLTERYQACVIVTVAAVKGSAPREPGAKMLVSDKGIYGTIGGGHLEFKAIDIARGLLAPDVAGTRQLQRFPLGASLGQCCGGAATLLFEPVLQQQSAEWVEALASWNRDRVPCVMVTPVHGDGARKLVVTRTETRGTLAGPELQERSIAIAREMLDAGTSEARLLAIDDAGSAPSAPALMLFEPVRRSDFRIVLFGAGHVGRALVNVLSGLRCDVTWVDGRDAEFPREVPVNVTVELTDAPEGEVDHAAADSYYLVMTHSHALDFELTERILRRGDFRYLGLIGSLTKRRTFEKRLIQRGVSEAALQRLTCPIGIAGISGKEPAAIAIAVAAELLQRHERASMESSDQHAALRSA